MQLSCILFDLDGTLLDTAPDLISALNKALSEQGLPCISNTEITPFISFGAAAMIRKCLKHSSSEELQNTILHRMLDHYQENIAEQTVLFSGISDLLESIESKGLKWGIVTNKRKRFTEPLIDALNLESRAACIISGDSTAHSKPHPEPMLSACRLADVEPHQCLYIGDSAHDIEAGNSAGMKTLAATYGYLKPDDTPESWEADAMVNSPAEILPWIENASWN